MPTAETIVPGIVLGACVMSPTVPPAPGRVVVGLTPQSPGGRHPPEPGDHVAPVRAQRLLLPMRHQVDVELVDADSLERAQLLDAVVGAADDAEALADLVARELPVGGADAGVVLV